MTPFNPYQALPTLEELAPHDFECFARYMTGWTLPNHQVAFCRRLDEIGKSEGTRQIFSAPPQHGKSEFVSVLYPGWKLGRKRDNRFMLLSYGADHSEGFGSAVQHMVRSEKYRRIFPDVLLSTSSKAKGEWRLAGRDGSHHPSFLAKGIGGGITGRGVDDLILDDVIENAQKAFSSVERETLFNFYVTVARTRIHKGTNIIVMFTRWFHDDLVGRLLSLEAARGRKPGIRPWDVMNFPAIATKGDPLGRAPGEPLWPEMHPIEELLEAQSLSPMLFQALYQGEPTIEGGNYVGRRDFPTYKKLPEDIAAVLLSFDTALTENTANDPSAGLAGILGRDGNIYLFRGTCDHYSPAQLQRLMLAMADDLALEFGDAFKGLAIENAASAKQHADYMRRHSMYPIKLVTPVGKKVERLFPHIDFLKTGRVHVPDPVAFPSSRAWTEPFFSQLERFPGSEHDDWVDALTQLLKVLRQRHAATGGASARLIQ